MSTKEATGEAVSLVEAPERSGGGSASDAARSNEVSAKATRRRFSAEYKRRILREVGACTKLGEIGALLRREGLYSSVLYQWRQARERGEIAGLAPKRRGPKAKEADDRDRVIIEQQREIAKLKKRTERAEALVEIQKKVSQLLGIQLASSDEDAS
jgi:transposase-like protein